MSVNHSPLRIGFVGAGAIVRQRHLPNLLSLPGVEIAAVVNSSPESSARFVAEQAPSAMPLNSWQELVSHPDIDIVWIGTTPHLHAPVTIAALNAGKHVFCQARMAPDLAAAKEMAAASEARPELVTMLCPPPHGMKGAKTVRRLLAEGSIGTPLHLHLNSFSASYADPATPAHWRQRRDLSGLNVMTLGIFVEVLHNWIGPITHATARGRVVHASRNGVPIDVPDILNVLCRFGNGVEGVLEFSGVARFAPNDSLQIYGSEGSLTYDFVTDEIRLARIGGSAPEIVPIPEAELGAWTVEADFIRAVREPGVGRPSPTFKEGVAYMQVVQAVADSLAADQSAVTGLCTP